MKVRHIVKASGLSDDTIRGILAVILAVGWIALMAIDSPHSAELGAVALVYLGYYGARRINGDGVKLRKE